MKFELPYVSYEFAIKLGIIAAVFQIFEHTRHRNWKKIQECLKQEYQKTKNWHGLNISFSLSLECIFEIIFFITQINATSVSPKSLIYFLSPFLKLMWFYLILSKIIIVIVNYLKILLTIDTLFCKFK